MKWRRVTLLAVVGLLVSGLFVVALAHKPPTKGPPRPPYQCGDPDWPSYSNLPGDRVHRVMIYDDPSSIQSPKLVAEQLRQRSSALAWWRHVSHYSKCEIKVLGRTITIRR
jgi:hypothetical protein